MVPKELERDGQSLNAMWNPPPVHEVQRRELPSSSRCAAPPFTPHEEGERRSRRRFAYYRNNARVIKEGLEAVGFTVYGAVNSPYIWCKTPEGVGSWEFFDKLLTEANIITTGVGFRPGRGLRA